MVIILSDNYRLPLPVGSFTALMYPIIRLPTRMAKYRRNWWTIIVKVVALR